MSEEKREELMEKAEAFRRSGKYIGKVEDFAKITEMLTFSSKAQLCRWNIRPTANFEGKFNQLADFLISGKKDGFFTCGFGEIVVEGIDRKGRVFKGYLSGISFITVCGELYYIADVYSNESCYDRPARFVLPDRSFSKSPL